MIPKTILLLFCLWLPSCSLFGTDPDRQLLEDHKKRMKMHQERMLEYQISMEKNKELMDENIRLMEPYKRRVEGYQKSMDHDRELMEYHKKLMEDYQQSIENYGKGKPIQANPSSSKPAPAPSEPTENSDRKKNQNDGIKHHVIPF